MSVIGSSTSSSQVWQQLISKTDTNGDDAIGVSELAELIGGDDSTSEASSIIGEFDTDSDGTLSEEEFNAAVGGSNLSGDYLSLQEMPPPPPPPAEESASSEDETSIEDLFASIDSDGDGSISLEELQEQLGISGDSAESSETDSAQTLMDLVQEILSDSDDSSSSDDLAAAPPPPPPPPSGAASETDTETDEDDTTVSNTSSLETEQSTSEGDMFMVRMMEQLYQQSNLGYATSSGVSFSI